MITHDAAKKRGSCHKLFTFPMLLYNIQKNLSMCESRIMGNLYHILIRINRHGKKTRSYPQTPPKQQKRPSKSLVSMLGRVMGVEPTTFRATI